MIQEEWKDIPGFETIYEVSSMGRIRSKERLNINSLGYVRRLKSRYKKYTRDEHGYMKVTLCKEGEMFYFTVHRLVVGTFKGVWSDREFQINHIDGNKANNSIENLEVVSCKENRHHAIRIGLWNEQGENSACSKLSRAQILEIRNKYSHNAVTHRDLAADYNVSKSTIGRIVRLESYKNVY